LVLVGGAIGLFVNIILDHIKTRRKLRSVATIIKMHILSHLTILNAINSIISRELSNYHIENLDKSKEFMNKLNINFKKKD